MTTIADELKKAHEGLGKLEDDVRAGMVNHHLADVIKSACGKLADAAKHPDAAAKVDDLKAKKEELERAKDPFYDPKVSATEHDEPAPPPPFPPHVEAAPYGDTMKTE